MQDELPNLKANAKFFWRKYKYIWRKYKVIFGGTSKQTNEEVKIIEVVHLYRVQVMESVIMYITDIRIKL